MPKRIFWLIGPQVIAITVPVFIAYAFWSSAQTVAMNSRRAEAEAAKAGAPGGATVSAPDAH